MNEYPESWDEWLLKQQQEDQDQTDQDEQYIEEQRSD